MEESFDLNYSTVDVNRLIRIAEERTRNRTKPGVVLNFMLGAAECHVVSDENRLLQVLLQLLANACNATSRGNITFGYKLRDNELYFFVRDTGWGIPEDMLSNVFDNAGPGSPGAGLAISRMIVQQLGGQMGVESPGEGKGATYWFTLPYDESLDYYPEETEDDIYGRNHNNAPVHQHVPAYDLNPSASAVPPARQQPVYNPQPVQPQSAPQQPAYTPQPVQPQPAPQQPAYSPQPAQPQSAPQQTVAAPQSAPSVSGEIGQEKQSTPGQKPYVLIAEDNASNFMLFEAVLSPYYRIEHAWDGVEAFEIFSQERPDIILMDINMPRKDGYEATADIRRVDQQVPIIAVTAYAFASDRERILRSGFNSYISKPINPPRLLQEMNNLLQA